MWHTDWKQLDDGRWFLCYRDDASRFIVSHGVFAEAIADAQTNGKLERFHGEIQRKQRRFGTIDELVRWYNHIKPHMSLDWDNLETPAKAYARKMPEKGTRVIDEQTGEEYDVK